MHCWSELNLEKDWQGVRPILSSDWPIIWARNFWHRLIRILLVTKFKCHSVSVWPRYVFSQPTQWVCHSADAIFWLGFRIVFRLLQPIYLKVSRNIKVDLFNVYSNPGNASFMTIPSDSTFTRFLTFHIGEYKKRPPNISLKSQMKTEIKVRAAVINTACNNSTLGGRLAFWCSRHLDTWYHDGKHGEDLVSLARSCSA